MLRLIIAAIALTGLTAGGMWWHRQSQTITSESGWVIPEHAKVVCYRFAIPVYVESTFTLLKNHCLDGSLLARQQAGSAELSVSQTQRLAEALISPRVYRSAACYDPNHIFVFYRSDGSVSGAAEICFGCAKVSTLPEMTRAQLYHQDFAALARLVEELGLWPSDFASVAEWQTLHLPD